MVCFFQSTLHPCNGQNIIFDRGSEGTNGEGYTERDTAAKLCCSKTVVHNADGKFNADGTFHDRKRSSHSWKTMPREDCSMKQ